jgi:mono/diheme cytochrome c family protein
MKKFIITSGLLIIFGICLLAESPARTANSNSIARGRKLYKMYCLSCHQYDGSGVPEINPSLRKSHYVSGPNAKLIKILLYGLSNDVEIDGDTYSNQMPAFGTVLKNQQIADVLTYIRNSFGNKAAVIYPTQIKKIRLL